MSPAFQENIEAWTVGTISGSARARFLHESSNTEMAPMKSTMDE